MTPNPCATVRGGAARMNAKRAQLCFVCGKMAAGKSLLAASSLWLLGSAAFTVAQPRGETFVIAWQSRLA